MDMMWGDEIAAAGLTDWRKLAQGLHARFLVDRMSSGAQFIVSVAEVGDQLGHHPVISLRKDVVDFKLTSDDAVYRDDDGGEHQVEWVTQKDVDLARRISEIAADQGLQADPGSVSVIELGLDTAASGAIAPMWAMLLTGSRESQGHGSPSDEIRDATGRVPNLWFGESVDESMRQRFHVEVYVPPEVVDERLAAAVAAGGVIVDDSHAPAMTVLEDADGNRGVICADTSVTAAGD